MRVLTIAACAMLLASWDGLAAEKPETSGLLAEKATMLAIKGNFAGAVQTYTRAIALNPSAADAWVYLRRGDAYASLRQWDPAIADYSEAIRRDPPFGVATAYLGRARVREYEGDKPAAIADYKRAVANGYTQAEVDLKRLTREI